MNGKWGEMDSWLIGTETKGGGKDDTREKKNEGTWQNIGCKGEETDRERRKGREREVWSYGPHQLQFLPPPLHTTQYQTNISTCVLVFTDKTSADQKLASGGRLLDFKNRRQRIHPSPVLAGENRIDKICQSRRLHQSLCCADGKLQRWSLHKFAGRHRSKG